MLVTRTRDLWLCTVNYLVKTILYYAYTYVYDTTRSSLYTVVAPDLQFKFRPHQLAYDPKVVINMYIHTHNRINIFIQYPLNIAAGAWLAKTSAEGSALQCFHSFSIHIQCIASVLLEIPVHSMPFCSGPPDFSCYMYACTCTCKNAKQSTQSSHQFQRKVSCLERDLNPRSPAYMAGVLPTKPPRQLSRLGTNPGNAKQLSLING